MKNKKYIKSMLIFATLGIAILFFVNISFAANSAKVNAETVNLRQTASSEGKVLNQLPLNCEVEIIETENNWSKVKVNGEVGYIRSDLLEISKDENTKEQESVSEDANIDSKQEDIVEVKKLVAEDTKLKIVPAINATDIIEVKKDEEVTIIENINGWVCIQTKTTKGWIRNNKLKEIEKIEDKQEEAIEQKEEAKQQEEKLLKTLYVNSETVNLRKEASTDSEIISRLSLNTAVDVYLEDNGWAKVKVGGREGYISLSLLSDKKKETSRNLDNLRKQEEDKNASIPSSGNSNSVVQTAKNYIGSRYVSGASGPSSFDCSGFTSYIYEQFGVSLSRTAAAQYGNGTYVSRDQLQPGDLIMFGSSASSINHVGIYIGGGEIVHAANPSRGVTTDTINSGYYNNNYVGARRVM